jgi:hypothetical protein
MTWLGGSYLQIPGTWDVMIRKIVVPDRQPTQEKFGKPHLKR